MDDVRLRAVSRAQGNNRAVEDGTVTPDGFAFDWVEITPLVAGFHHGVEPNRDMLETLARYAVEQHIVDGPVDVPSLFASATRDLVG